MAKDLPSMEHSFNLDVEGSDTKKKFTGAFTYTRPSIGTSLEIAKTQKRLMAGEEQDEDTAFLLTVLANLRHTLNKSPGWWEASNYGADLYDLNVILAIYKETRDFESSWRDSVWGKEELSTNESAAAPVSPKEV